jgi:hypothetical protein
VVVDVGQVLGLLTEGIHDVRRVIRVHLIDGYN